MADRLFAVMPARMAETEVVVVYVIHFLLPTVPSAPICEVPVQWRRKLDSTPGLAYLFFE